MKPSVLRTPLNQIDRESSSFRQVPAFYPQDRRNSKLFGTVWRVSVTRTASVPRLLNSLLLGLIRNGNKKEDLAGAIRSRYSISTNSFSGQVKEAKALICLGPPFLQIYSIGK